jgi:predicted SprT family Zn-dependent metalloprotease
MTAQEAIKRLQYERPAREYHSNLNEVFDMAIEALEKQIPFKPKEYEDKHYSCKCGNILLMKWKKYNTELTPKSEGLPYCLNCGQALDWSEP